MEVSSNHKVVVRVGRTGRGRLIPVLRLLGWILAGATIVIGLFLLIQAVWHPFDSLIALLN